MNFSTIIIIIIIIIIIAAILEFEKTLGRRLGQSWTQLHTLSQTFCHGFFFGGGGRGKELEANKLPQNNRCNRQSLALTYTGKAAAVVTTEITD